jgi:hypothetical protein
MLRGCIRVSISSLERLARDGGSRCFNDEGTMRDVYNQSCFGDRFWFTDGWRSNEMGVVGHLSICTAGIWVLHFGALGRAVSCTVQKLWDTSCMLCMTSIGADVAGLGRPRTRCRCVAGKAQRNVFEV